jgi:hypothetical protein
MTHPGPNARSRDHQRTPAPCPPLNPPAHVKRRPRSITHGLNGHVPVQHRLQVACDSQVTRFCGLPMTKASILSIN